MMGFMINNVKWCLKMDYETSYTEDFMKFITKHIPNIYDRYSRVCLNTGNFHCHVCTPSHLGELNGAAKFWFCRALNVIRCYKLFQKYMSLYVQV
jgi:hypothetical protein